jgi:hypothetical protein
LSCQGSSVDLRACTNNIRIIFVHPQFAPLKSDCHDPMKHISSGSKVVARDSKCIRYYWAFPNFSLIVAP